MTRLVEPESSTTTSPSSSSSTISPRLSGPEDPESFYAGFDGPNDPGHPRNWSSTRKVIFVAVVCIAIFAVSFASSIFGPASPILAAQHHVSETVMQLGVSLFVAGFAVGPLLWGPFAEVVGHSIPVLIGLCCCGLLHIPLGLAESVATILVIRFLAGAFGSAVLAVGSGMVSELYGPIPRGTALACTATVVNLGSVFAPIVSSYVVARVSWRWLAWITLAFFGCVAPLAVFFLKETAPRRILASRARKLRRAGERTGSHSEPALDIKLMARKYLTKPVVLFCKEPILIIMTIHLTFVYGLLYMAYQLFPLAYKVRGWAMDSATLPFISVALGLMASPILVAVFMTTWYKGRWLERGRQCAPEDRLPPMILGACLLPPALLWFGWSMETHWFSQVVASLFIGLGLQLVFISGIVYIVDVYMTNVVSAISIHVTIRSIFAASFPIWTRAMYDALGVEWMATALAGFAAVMMPFPILFFVYGPKIRSWSRYSVKE
ncbi:major facilitator superfamily domain-containing protein [Plectosphaerella cucumerina]|uniref:Major facilitator superfamily domain-containing protein n=1 Tax=Plectosphaerella cucumerina TaxID=40658 RepID=A0A8K0TID2_9PEZI|nr:major facilitator superfamily domain-containing protein [Plectosphaerella cucumerina]